VSNNEFFRRLARAVGLDAEAFAATDQILIEQALQVDHDWLEGIDWRSLSELPRQKVKLGADRRPLIDTPIPTPDGRFHIEPMATRPPDGPVQLDEDELWLLSPSRRETIKSSYGNVASVIKAGEPELLVHPDDMRRLGLREGQWVTVYNQLGETRMRAWGSPVPQPGTVVSYAVRWNQAARGSNVNQLTPAGVSTIGQGATFYDARVRIRS
jgi:anaerobic selenocysteine-containing dehydrogenase